MRRNLFIIFTLLAFSLMGCDKLDFLKPKKVRPEKAAPPLVKGTVIAKVNNTPITLEELEQEIEVYNNMMQDKPEQKITTRDQKINYLKNEMVRRALFYQEGLDRGVDRKEEVNQALEKTKRDLVVVGLIQEETKGIDVTSQEIEDYYNAYKEQMKEVEERKVREVMLNTEAEAKQVLIQLLQGQDFAEIAKQSSKSTSAVKGGDLGFVKPGEKFTSFDAVAFSDTLEVGAISNIFKGPGGYYILKLEGKRGGKQKSLSELWDDIKRLLVFLKQQQRVEELAEKLSKNARLEFFEGEIK